MVLVDFHRYSNRNNDFERLINMSSIGMSCPSCKDSGPLKVDKMESDMRKWRLHCWMCGHVMEEGSYWLHNGSTIKEGWERHCKELGWDVAAPQGFEP